MSLFWLVVVVLLIAAMGVLWHSARAQQHDVKDDRDALNTRFYQQRLQELHEDEAQGVIAERPQMEAELQQALLNDVPNSPSTAVARPFHRGWLLPGCALLVLLSLALYLKTGGYARVSEWQRIQAEYPALRARIMDEQATPPSRDELARFGLGLRGALQTEPNNVSDWLMLGRVNMVLNQLDNASQAFRHALTLAPHDASVKLSYAEVLTRSSDASDNREAEMMLQEMLKSDPDNPRVLSLLAFNAFTQQNFAQAIAAWQQLLRLLPPQDARRVEIERGIAQAQSAAGVASVRVPVTLTLSKGAESVLPQGGVLYISVSDGHSPVPVAVKRVPLSHFPLSLTLDDSDAMMPSRLLSAQQTIQVRARISRDGSANPQSGDWFGESAPVPLDGQPLTVDIGRQQP